MKSERWRLHGGKSTGPRTPEGLARSRRASWEHGFFSAGAIATRREARASLNAPRELVAKGAV